MPEMHLATNDKAMMLPVSAGFRSHDDMHNDIP